jgi:Asp/Glu/hydantoin racemase
MNMSKKVAVIHTSFVSVNDLKNLFKEIMPSVRMINLVDDSLLAEVLDHGGLTNNVTRRICAYALEAEAMGADAIFNQCSSVGEAVDVARRVLHIPFIKVDESMAEEAVDFGGTIAVIATVPSTLGPSMRLIEQSARDKNKKIQLRGCLVEGAFDILVKQNDKEQHNRMVLRTIENESERADVIVLAQGSMICLLPQLSGIKIPVLTSPRSGVNRVKQVLFQ